jgi:hypothetical protein
MVPHEVRDDDASGATDALYAVNQHPLAFLARIICLSRKGQEGGGMPSTVWVCMRARMYAGPCGCVGVVVGILIVGHKPHIHE